MIREREGMTIYLKDGTHFYISEDEIKRISDFAYDCWGDRNYETTVRRDWDSLGSEILEKDHLKHKVFIKSLKDKSGMTSEQIDSLELFLRLDEQLNEGENPYKAALWKHTDCKGNTSSILNNAEEIKVLLCKKRVSEVLKGFSEATVNRISDILGANIHLNKLWDHNSFVGQKMNIAVAAIKELKATIKMLSGHIQKCSQSEVYPPIVSDAMNESIKLATAYRDFLESEIRKSRFKSDGDEYKNLTIRDEWNTMVVDIANTLQKEVPKINKARHGKNQIKTPALTATLLSVSYPDIWGKLSPAKATKNIGDRLRGRENGSGDNVNWLYERIPDS